MFVAYGTQVLYTPTRTKVIYSDAMARHAWVLCSFMTLTIELYKLSLCDTLCLSRVINLNSVTIVWLRWFDDCFDFYGPFLKK